MTTEHTSEALLFFRQHWRHNAFRSEQKKAIEAALRGRDALVVMATGGGTSVCYQVPALVNKKLTLVVSPLIALMQDQVSALDKRDIPATYLEKGFSQRTLAKRLEGASKGRYRILYVSPERLRSRFFRGYAKKLDVGLLAIDEAHCVSAWGHDFRPSYRNIPEAYSLIGRPPVMATTGTATPQVREDITQGLRLNDPVRIVGGFGRSNIMFRTVLGGADRGTVLRQVIAQHPGSGIVYAGTRRQVEHWKSWLRREGCTAVAYHAGLEPRARTAAYRKWMRREARVVVATNAFGMGVDKSDVRFVVHLTPPYSLDAYYQEAGRAGRDTRPAVAVLVAGAADRRRQHATIARRYPTPDQVSAVYNAIRTRMQLAHGNMPDTPVPVDLATVAATARCSPAAAERIINLVAAQGLWTVLPGHAGGGMIRMWQSAYDIRRFALNLKNEDRYRFLMMLLRTVDALAYREWVEKDLTKLADAMSLSQAQFLEEIAFLEARNILSWRSAGGDLRLKLKAEYAEQAPVDQRSVVHGHQNAVAQLRGMWRYIDEVRCRGRLLLQHYGEDANRPCGHCDLCEAKEAT